MRKIAITIISGVILLTSCAHNNATYYRKQVKEGYVLWREVHPTTKHGICASMLSGDLGWEVDHPYGVNLDTQMSIGTDARLFTSQQDAEAWAESVCPTKAVKP